MTFRLGTTDGPGGGWRLGTSDRQIFASGAASITSVTGSAADIVRSGETVTIVGTNFEAAQGTGTVTIGGVAVAGYTSWADTQIVVTAPVQGLMFTGTKTVIVTPDTNAAGQRGGISYLPPTGWTFKRLTTTTIPADSLAAGITGVAVGDEVYTETTWTRVGEVETATWSWNNEGDGTGYLSGYTTDGDYAGDVEFRDATDGNDTDNGPKTITIDTTAPAGYTVSWDQAEITDLNETAVSFTFAAAEVGTTYAYTITSSGGGTPVTDTGTVSTATDQITGINVSGLGNGNVTLSVTLTDQAGFVGSAAQDGITKSAGDVTAPSGYTISIDQAIVDATNITATSFTFAGAEVGASWSLAVTSAGGGGPINYGGTIATATDQITGIDVSGLGNGLLTYSVTLTDTAGNTGAAATDAVTKSFLEFTAQPAALNVGTTAARFRFTASGEASITYAVVVVTNGAAEPAAADVLAGTVSGSVSELIGQTATSDTQEATDDIGGLEASTAYDAYIAIDDSVSDPLLGPKIDFTTDALSASGTIVIDVIDDIVTNIVADIAA